VGRKVYYLLATGNMISSTGIDMMQVSGYSVVADKINFLRFTTHFRSVHRGQFFTEMKTTTVRKLLPENWGFLCPVHTPDGGPCGLLNHLAAPAMVVSHPVSEADFARTAARAARPAGAEAEARDEAAEEDEGGAGAGAGAGGSGRSGRCGGGGEPAERQEAQARGGRDSVRERPCFQYQVRRKESGALPCIFGH
jgi:hypothetical protein